MFRGHPGLAGEQAALSNNFGLIAGVSLLLVTPLSAPGCYAEEHKLANAYVSICTCSRIVYEQLLTKVQKAALYTLSRGDATCRGS